MKKLFVLLLMGLSLNLSSQEVKVNKKLRIEPGFLYHWNSLNVDGYFGRLGTGGTTSANSLSGVDIRLSIPTKYDFIDITFGTILEKSWDQYLTPNMKYLMTGGGVYAGISPRIEGKHFGITSTFAVGILSYKEYFYYYSSIPDPDIDVNITKASILGAISSIGFYAKVGSVGINPQAQVTISGGNNSSFLFYGLVFPVTVQF